MGKEFVKNEFVKAKFVKAEHTKCPVAEISAYIDGELSHNEQAILENHLKECEICREELNEQKQTVCLLDMAFSYDKNMPIPEGFVENIILRAENDVKGLKNKDELFKSVVLAFSVMISMSAASLFGGVYLNTSVFASLKLFYNVIYEFLFGLSVVMRSIGTFLFSISVFSVSALFISIVCLILLVRFLFSAEEREIAQ